MAILTQLTVDRARARGQRFEIPDGPAGVPGFALRVGVTGAKTYVLRYRFGTRQPRAVIGSAAVLSLSEARARARKLVDQIKAGLDPAEPGTGRRVRQRNTVASVVEEYLERHVRRNLKSATWTERLLKGDVVGAWGERPIQSITRADVVRLGDSIADRGAGVMANRTLQLVHRFFAWCVKRSIVEINPAAGVDLPYKERPRDRTLTEAEIKSIWEAFEVMAWPFGMIGRMLLLTAARRSEVAGMSWSEIDFQKALWVVPAERVKNGVAHTLPLVPEAIAILEACPRIAGSDLVFPSSRAGAGAVSAFSGALARAHKLSATSGWSWHDLRRSVRSEMAKLGVLPHVGERVLAHVVGSEVARVYDVHRYLPEMRRALELWGAELARITTGSETKVASARPAKPAVRG